ncbi:MAG TPA: molybdopterin adenylyltransferase, partial [Burkholderiaceae bacterium]|nr:molybdopterin adenylyltransferase [Burkholderiaceae bacterium]
MTEPTPNAAPTAAATALPPPEPIRIGLVSVSDRASSGVYEDKGLPALR